MSYSVSRKKNAFYTYNICNEANKESWERERKRTFVNMNYFQLYYIDIISINNTFEYHLNMGFFPLY